MMDFDLLKKSLTNYDFIKSITKDEESQLNFMNTLTTNQLTVHQILELINKATDKQVGSLLIIHLFSQHEYLNRLKGESILTRVINNKPHSPSRLNTLVYKLDLSNIPTTLLEHLHPEAAFSILCSILHFHRLTEVQANILLQHCPAEITTYWLKHFYSMPNAHYFLAHLIRNAPAQVCHELKRMDADKTEAILKKIITHLELFNPFPDLLSNTNEEKHLIIAMLQYLNGHKHEHYIRYINQVTEHLLNNKHQFSLPAIQLFITLHGLREFSELKNKTSHLTNQYLRAKAQSGDISIFYSGKTVNLACMTQLIQSDANQTTPEHETKPFYRSWLSLTNPKEENTPESPLIKELANHKKTVTAFDYFLMHYEGNNQSIGIVIKDYLNYFAQNKLNDHTSISIYHTVLLMIRPDIKLSIKQAIYDALLQVPELYDEHIGSSLLLFNAEQTIKHFGMQGGEENYKLVLNLCNWALRKLEPNIHKEIINSALIAQREAQLELDFTTTKGFFSRLWLQLKRCWAYDWTGFFTPKSPVYVAPAHTLNPKHQNSTDEQNSLLKFSNPEKNLPRLIAALEQHYTLKQLDELMNTMSKYSFKAIPETLNIRQKINHIFHELLLISKQNQVIGTWLLKNQRLFLLNRFHVLELMLTQGSSEQLNILIKEIKEDSTHFNFVVNEWIDEQPEIQVYTTTNREQVDPNILNTASNLVSDAWNWTKGGLGGFFTQQKPTIGSTLTQESLSPR